MKQYKKQAEKSHFQCLYHTAIETIYTLSYHDNIYKTPTVLSSWISRKQSSYLYLEKGFI
jgi:hypothetical protein